jgi:hypothetical protein
MRGFITIAVLLGLIVLGSAAKSYSIQQLLEEKARLMKTGLNGEEVLNQLTYHGEGVTDGQETATLNFVDQAYRSFSGDQYANAVYIQQKVEESFGGRWNVEIFGNDPSWGRATHLLNDQWILLFGYGDAGWDYIIWTPEC